MVRYIKVKLDELEDYLLKHPTAKVVGLTKPEREVIKHEGKHVVKYPNSYPGYVSEH